MAYNGVLFTNDNLINHPETIFALCLAVPSQIVSVGVFCFFIWYFQDKAWGFGRIFAMAALFFSILSTLTMILQNFTTYIIFFWTINNFVSNLMFLLLGLVNLQFLLVFGDILPSKKYVTKENVFYYQIAVTVTHFVLCILNYVSSLVNLGSTLSDLEVIGMILYYGFVLFWYIIQFSVLVHMIRKNRANLVSNHPQQVNKQFEKLVHLIVSSLILIIFAGLAFIISNSNFGGIDIDTLMAANTCTIIALSLNGFFFCIVLFVMEATITMQIGNSCGSLLSNRAPTKPKRLATNSVREQHSKHLSHTNSSKRT